MLQTVANREVFVVEFDTMPALPITWNTPEEKPYAQSLDDAIRVGTITEPGKYGIEITSTDEHRVYYDIHLIEE